MFKNIIYSFLIMLSTASCTKIFDATAEGKKWYLLSQNNSDRFMRKIFFITPRTGWMIGNDGAVLKTSDGGHAWNRQTSGTAKDLWELFFITNEEGWIIGMNNTFLYTSNGGGKWMQINVYDDTTKHNSDIYFVNNKTGWFLNNHGDLFKTNDGGSTWNKIYVFSGFGWSNLKFIDSNYGYASKFWGSTLMKTVDGGISWQEIPLFIPDAKLGIMVKDIFFVDRYTGFYTWAWCSGGIFETAAPVRKTEDGGFTWVHQDSVMSPFLDIIRFTDSENGFLAGFNLIYSTNNSGRNWKLFTELDENSTISDMYFDENNIGWVLTSTGSVYKFVR